MKKNFLPISIDITNQKILIVGGGKSAFKKIKILQRFNADIEVIAIKVSDEIKQSGILFYEKAYNKKYLNTYFMLYSCTNNKTIDTQIVDDCKEAGVLVNIHDKPALCQFISPAVYQNGNVTVAVGSNGENVYESIRQRNSIAKILEEQYCKIK